MLKQTWLRAAGAIFVVIVTFHVGSAEATVSQSCIDYRQAIVNLETSSGPHVGGLSFDLYLRQLYQHDCIDNPGYRHPPEYWYRLDGSATGVELGKGEHPADGAYATTKEHAKACEGMSSPSVCALALDADDAGGKVKYDRADELPPLGLTIGGSAYSADASCLNALQTLGAQDKADYTGSRSLRAAARARLAVWAMQTHCPDLLAQFERQIGISAPADDPSKQNRAPEPDVVRFGEGAGSLVRSGFDGAAASTPSASVANAASDPGFQEMCRQADQNMKRCRAQVGTPTRAPAGQTGAFNDCANLYGQVVAMCRATGNAATLADVSPQCQATAQAYAAAAQAHDQQGTMANYQALKQSCPDVLNAIAQRTGMALPQDISASPDLPSQASPFPTRSTDGSMTQTIMGGCVAARDSCTGIANSLSAGTSDAARDAVFANAMEFGIALGNLMIQGMELAQMIDAMKHTNSNMSSLTPAVRTSNGNMWGTDGPPPPVARSRGVNRSGLSGVP